MKRCYMCKQEKELDSFPKNKSKPDGHGHRCLECQKILSKQHYQNNKQIYKERFRSHRIATRIYLQELKKDLKCIICGESDPICIDFHHKDKAQKVACISKMVRDYGMEKVLEEIKKCDPLCANCHRKLHRDEILAGDSYALHGARD